MLKVTIENEAIKEFIVSGNINRVAAEISAVIKAVYQLTKNDDAMAAELFKWAIQKGTQGDDSPVWDDDVPLVNLENINRGG